MRLSRSDLGDTTGLDFHEDLRTGSRTCYSKQLSIMRALLHRRGGGKRERKRERGVSRYPRKSGISLNLKIDESGESATHFSHIPSRSLIRLYIAIPCVSLVYYFYLLYIHFNIPLESSDVPG